MSVFEHEDRDDPFNESTAVTLDPGQEATVRFEPAERQSDYFLPQVAISKFPNSSYRVETDETNEYGPAPLPPTTPDDDADTFRPPTTFSDYVTVTIANLDGSSTRTYYVQVTGWERRKFTDEGGW